MVSREVQNSTMNTIDKQYYLSLINELRNLTNIKLMMDILKRDFSDHQIIIASIFEYEFDPLNTIEIVNRLIEIE